MNTQPSENHVALPTDEAVQAFWQEWKRENSEKAAALPERVNGTRRKMVRRCGFHGGGGIVGNSTRSLRG